MSKKIGIYILLAATKHIIAVANRNEQRIKAFGGDGLWIVVQLLIAIAGILVTVIEAGSNAEGDWLAPLTAPNSQTINAVHAAVAQFDVAAGVGEG